MIVSHKHRFIFLELPLAGGDPLLQYFLPLLGDQDLVIVDGQQACDSARYDPGSLALSQYATAAAIRGQLDPDTWNDYLKFAFVRNPWEMLVAEFRSHTSDVGSLASDAAKAPGIASEFEDYLLSLQPMQPCFSEYLCAEDGELLIDYVGHYACLDQDLQTLFERLGLARADRDVEITAPLSDYPDYYNALTRDLVRQQFRVDLDRFDLHFDSPVSTRQAAPPGAPDHLIAHFCHHKAGTLWFQRVLKNLAARLGWKFQSCFQQELESDAQIFMQENSRVELELLPAYRGSHIIRDPRDIVVSGYFYHLWCEESWCRENRKKFGGRSYQEMLNSLPLAQGIEMEIENCSSTFSRMSQWDYRNPQLIEVRFEDLIRDQYATFRAVFEKYGLSSRQIDIGMTVVEECDFERSTGRKKGQEAQNSHLRKGISGDWVNHFTSRHKRKFSACYPGLLTKLGYETDDNW